LQQEKRRAQVTENLCSPGQPDQIIVLQDTTMSLKITAGYKRKDKAFMAQTDQLYQIPGLRMGRFCIPEHAVILPYRLHHQFGLKENRGLVLPLLQELALLGWQFVSAD